MNATHCGCGTVRVCFRLALSCLLSFVPSVLSAAGTPAGTRIDNQATVVYTTTDSAARHTVYGNMLSLTVGQRAVVNLAPASAQRSGRLGETVDYPIRVTNSGNGRDSFSIAAMSSLGFPARVYRDVNGDGVLTAPEVAAGPIAATPGLTADAELALVVRLTVGDSTGFNGAIDLVTVTAASIFDPTQRATAIYRTNISSAALGITVTVSNPSPQPSTRVTYSITCTNSGAARADSITVTDVLHPMLHFVNGSSSPSTTTVGGQTLTWTLPPLDSGATASITFIVELDDALTAGTVVHNPVDAAYADGVTRRMVRGIERSFITIAAGGVETVTIAPDSSLFGEVGDTVALPMLVTNLSATSRDYGLEAMSSRGIVWTMFADVNADGRLDAGEPMVTATGPMASGATARFIASGRLLLVARDSTIDTSRFTARSAANPANAATCRSVVTIGRPIMTLRKTATAPNPIAGSNIIYTISYANGGSGRAERFRIVDPLPANTTLVPGSIRVNAVAKTEAADADEATIANTTLTVDIGPVAPGATGAVEFTVHIN